MPSTSSPTYIPYYLKNQFIPINSKIGTFIPFTISNKDYNINPIYDKMELKKELLEWETPFNKNNEGYWPLEKTPYIYI